MSADDRQKAEEILRKRRRAAKGLVDQPEGKAPEGAELEEREETRTVRGAVAAAGLRRSG